MSKARDLADFVSAGSPLADGTISVSEVSGAAPTASPTFTGTVTASALTVAASTSLVKLEDTDTNAYAQIATDGSGIVNIAADEGSTGASPRITFDVSTTERMRIDSSGNVGIGTSSPSAALDVSTGGSTKAAIFDGNGVDITHPTLPSNLFLGTQTGSDVKIASAGAYPMLFHTNGSEAFRFGTSGQLGIGGANYGTSGQVLTSGGSGAAPSWQSVSFTTNVVTSNTTASANNHYYLNAATLTLTLPASPSVGDEVRISEVAGNTDCVIGRNGSNIMGDASDLTIDTAYLVLSLRYVDATIGWAFS